MPSNSSWSAPGSISSTGSTAIRTVFPSPAASPVIGSR